jgi:2-oxoglutarate ferredoxin oxidoreductase subunit beta
LIKAAVKHSGFALVDILQPCVTFNKINTFEWYRQRVYHVESEYNPEDRIIAFKKALEWGDRIPTGIIFKNNRKTLEERIPVIQDKPLIRQSFDSSKIQETLKEFY